MLGEYGSASPPPHIWDGSEPATGGVAPSFRCRTGGGWNNVYVQIKYIFPRRTTALGKKIKIKIKIIEIKRTAALAHPIPYMAELISPDGYVEKKFLILYVVKKN